MGAPVTPVFMPDVPKAQPVRAVRRIFKYPVELTDSFAIDLPAGAEVLTVQTQGDAPFIWALVVDHARLEPRHFRLCGTGHVLGDGTRYVGTFQLHDGAFVGHLFEVRRA